MPGRTIVVSSNCTTAGTTAVLQEIFSDDKIIAAPLAGASDEALLARLQGADTWITDGPGERVRGICQNAPGTDLLRIPRLLFSAFHPDLVYASNLADGALVHPHYNSAIALWAYRSGLDVNATERLFCREVFSGLGYFRRWDYSVALLRKSFSESALRFETFFPCIQRSGVFMYSINHPKMAVIVLLAKLIALRLGQDESILPVDFYMKDALMDSDIWPIYPEVGYELALHAGYEWRLAGRRFSGLRPYLEFAFSEYARHGVAPELLALHPHPAYPLTLDALDKVLGPRAGIRP